MLFGTNWIHAETKMVDSLKGLALVWVPPFVMSHVY